MNNSTFSIEMDTREPLLFAEIIKKLKFSDIKTSANSDEFYICFLIGKMVQWYRKNISDQVVTPKDIINVLQEYAPIYTEELVGDDWEREIIFDDIWLRYTTKIVNTIWKEEL